MRINRIQRHIVESVFSQDFLQTPCPDIVNNESADILRILNNGVYQAGFAQTQQAYDEAVSNVFETLDFLEPHLQGRQYLLGEQLTEADIRAFVTPIRFDVAYYGLFKTKLKSISDYANLFSYMQRLYYYPGIAETVNFDHIKQGYYSLHALNPTGIVPTGPEISWLR